MVQLIMNVNTNDNHYYLGCPSIFFDAFKTNYILFPVRLSIGDAVDILNRGSRV